MHFFICYRVRKQFYHLFPTEVCQVLRCRLPLHSLRRLNVALELQLNNTKKITGISRNVFPILCNVLVSDFLFLDKKEIVNFTSEIGYRQDIDIVVANFSISTISVSCYQKCMTWDSEDSTPVLMDSDSWVVESNTSVVLA